MGTGTGSGEGAVVVLIGQKGVWRLAEHDTRGSLRRERTATFARLSSNGGKSCRSHKLASGALVYYFWWGVMSRHERPASLWDSLNQIIYSSYCKAIIMQQE